MCITIVLVNKKQPNLSLVVIGKVFCLSGFLHKTAPKNEIPCNGGCVKHFSNQQTR